MTNAADPPIRRLFACGRPEGSNRPGRLESCSDRGFLLSAVTPLDTGAGQEGSSAILHPDCAFVTALNPNIEIIRILTLRQAYSCCSY
jgi:hypothetical protein